MSEPHEVHREVAAAVSEALTGDEWTRDALVEHTAGSRPTRLGVW